MIKPVHPFPARMAPELALGTLQKLREGSIVLDPMAGSGTVVRQATDLGFSSIGLDVDPLAVLMARVWTTRIDFVILDRIYSEFLKTARTIAEVEIALPWIDDDAETARFVEYWFAEQQRSDLRRIAAALYQLAELKHDKPSQAAALDVIRLSLSRIIITKETGASLARDTSHSRPHKVASTSTYDVFVGLDRSFRILRDRLLNAPPVGIARVELGDARAMTSVENASVDAVLTSPPYLNAIDYLRGHRLALVWLGMTCAEIRTIRAESIGAERGITIASRTDDFVAIRNAIGEVKRLPSQYQGMIDRYILDVRNTMLEVTRVLRNGGSATFVVGNSCLKDIFVNNTESVAVAGKLAGLSETGRTERELPARSRYLPLAQGALSKRMRTEAILSFVKR